MCGVGVAADFRESVPVGSPATREMRFDRVSELAALKSQFHHKRNAHAGDYLLSRMYIAKTRQSLCLAVGKAPLGAYWGPSSSSRQHFSCNAFMATNAVPSL